MMTMYFGGVFLLSALLVTGLAWLNLWLQPGLILTGVFAVLTLDSVVALLLSAHARPQQPA
jgi:hypothetical protein